ncbi:PAS domain S-box protein [Sphingobium sp. AR-3-1]|uniref:PAS domain S-box protein n=1 Tax=Sphingobium psychrophilum TaxID=2728834 RepID=A0A7X9X0S6_9SPHN|nr:PAS domain S-box protein [Sphingobium psychrophilum]
MSQLHDLRSESLGSVLRTALDAVVVMRTDGTIAGWNDVAERTFGWSFRDASGRRMSDLIIPERFRADHEKGLAHFLATGEGPVLNQHIEIHALHRDGRELPVELSITQTSQFGEPVFLGFLRDIIPRLSDQNLCAHWRSPIVMMRQG